jgi:enterochelin esterase-like enzyme
MTPALPPQVRVGRLEHHTDLFSPSLARAVDVWLPTQYDLQPELRCRVLYMHDAQNLFDPNLAHGGQTWGVAETLTRCSDLEPTIVVGVWNTEQRWRDYYPRSAFEHLEPKQQTITLERLGGEPRSDHYVHEIAFKLKPFMNRTYRTRSAPADTLIAGSSMGGLISLYAAEQHPTVFGGAACLSTHWPAGGDAMVNALADALPTANTQRLYFDYGTETLDVNYEPFQRRFDMRLEAQGWDANHWITRKFVGASHDEASWRSRLEIPLRFLLGEPAQRRLESDHSS